MSASQAPRPDGGPRRRGLLGGSIVAMLAAAVLLWAASAVVWTEQRYRTQFSGDRTAELAGSVVLPELVPMALATLAAIAAVLATGGWVRRVIGVLVAAEGGLLLWRLVGLLIGPAGVERIPQAPPGSEPLRVLSTGFVGPALVALAASLLLATGLLILVRAKRMPAMGAKYSAPAAARETRDPDRQWWEALDEGEDPTHDNDSRT